MARLDAMPVDRILCLGDIVGYGASPNECCDLLRAANVLAVQGNHDRAAVQPGEERWFTPAAKQCILWTREQLSEHNRGFLGALCVRAKVEGANLCHGALFDPDFYTTTPDEASMSMRLMTEPLCWFGHTHYAEWFEEEVVGSIPIQRSATRGAAVQLIATSRYLINPGAVGQPRDGNSMAAYALWNTETGAVDLQRVPYNIRAAQDKMAAASLPGNMSARLLLGV
jgi:diadenosine tetraphosphatase ApaH/serine/threonine PP2A family protein phosphatase